MWKSLVQGTDDSILRRMRIACCIRKAANTHSVYVILIALPLQHWLRERVLILRYKFIACVDVCKLNFSLQRNLCYVIQLRHHIQCRGLLSLFGIKVLSLFLWWRWRQKVPPNLVTTYDMIYLLTAIGLTPGGSSTVRIYPQTIHRMTQSKQYIEQHKNFGRVQPVPCLGKLYTGICLTTEEEARKNLSEGSRTISYYIVSQPRVFET
jgi:hypothetical protein